MSHDVHYFEESGIEEGNARVPAWLGVLLLIIAAVWIWYLTSHIEGAQPSSAGIHKKKALEDRAAAPAEQDGAGGDEDDGDHEADGAEGH